LGQRREIDQRVADGQEQPVDHRRSSICPRPVRFWSHPFRQNGGELILRRLTRLPGLVIAAWLAVSAPVAASSLPGGGEAAHTIYVVSNGWHTGIALAREDLPPGRVPEVADFPDAPFFEFGWGDREYYPTPQPSFAMALDAAMLPSPAVMHLVGLQWPPQQSFPEAEVLAVTLSAAQLDRMIATIAASFDRPAGGRAAAIAPGLYANSRFYPAHGRFHLFNTCNSWTARILAEAGLSLSGSRVIRAEDLMSRLRALPGVTTVSRGPD
jgi:uncharacterized protein (TIGR02117 family)